MTDKEIIEGLIARDERITSQFFFKDCRPLFLSIIRKVFDGAIVDYEEIISEIYILLMEDDARRLRQFKYDSTVYQWLKTIGIRLCLKLKNAGSVIDNTSNEPLDNKDNDDDCAEMSQAKMDIDVLLGKMKNQRYASVIRMSMIDGMDAEEVAAALSVTIDNLYNIKRRAISALAEVALNDKKHYDGK